MISVQHWIDCPCETHRRAAKQAAKTVWVGPLNPAAAANAALSASRIEREPVKAAERAARDAAAAAWHALQTLRAYDGPTAIGSIGTKVSERDVRAAIRGALVPWALGQDLGPISRARGPGP